MDTAQWPQEIVVKPIEEIVATNTCPQPADQKKPRPQKEQALNCPRCHSINTKFCYYNNYSLTQPRYFCKTCRRYWTEGGSLRNIPVGGGSRKNKRSSVSCSSPSTKKVNPDHHLPTLSPPISLSQNCTQNPKIHEGQDLNLAFPNISELVQQNNNTTSASASSSTSTTTTITTTTPSTSHLSALELLTGITSNSRGFHSFMPVQVPADPNIVHSTYGFPLQDFKPTLNFSLDHGIGGSGFASLHGVQETSGRVLFPFADLKQASSTNPTMDQNNNNNNNNKEQQGYSTGYWTGMLGGGGSWFWGVSRRKGSFIPTGKQVSPWTKLAKEE